MKFLIGITVLLSGCSTMFYYPTKTIYIKPEQIRASHENVEFESASHNKLKGLLICAISCVNSEKPLIVQFHGNGQNMTAHMLSLYWLIDKGYDYFTFDYAGYGDSEGTATPPETLLDGEAALRWATQRFPGLKLVVFGQSLGGAIALKVAIQNKDTHEFPIAMVIAESTFSSYQGIAADVMSRTWVTWPLQPLAFVVLSDAYAPGRDVAKLSPTPLIVIHGEKDPVVPLRFGRKIYELAKSPKEFWTYKESGHVVSSLAEHGKINDQLVERFKQLEN